MIIPNPMAHVYMRWTWPLDTNGQPTAREWDPPLSYSNGSSANVASKFMNDVDMFIIIFFEPNFDNFDSALAHGIVNATTTGLVLAVAAEDETSSSDA